MKQLEAVYKVIDDMLIGTTERHAVPCGEVQNWMLDMRSELKSLELELGLTPEPEPIPELASVPAP